MKEKYEIPVNKNVQWIKSIVSHIHVGRRPNPILKIVIKIYYLVRKSERPPPNDK